MPFVIRKIETVEEKVDVFYPGQKKPEKMPVVVRYITETERKELLDAVSPDKGRDQMADRDILLQVISDIPGLVTEDGESLDYSEEVLDQLLDVRCYCSALKGLMLSILYGKEFAEKFREKN
ncbi:MAG: hypothetical protein CMH98_04715 [Oceanospirillaceae bacterium]|nr:hypothetical protein [Oceanospirillaceae bacterium]